MASITSLRALGQVRGASLSHSQFPGHLLDMRIEQEKSPSHRTSAVGPYEPGGKLAPIVALFSFGHAS